MDHPKKQIPHVIHTLCEGTPSEQKAALDTYFVPNASFSHPMCRVPKFSHVSVPLIGEINSRWVIWMIYRWYKILSPRIILTVEAAEFNQSASLLFINMHQVFSLFFVPFYAPKVHLTTVLTLNHSSNDNKYYITHQEDLYQTTELIKFVLPGGSTVIYFLHLFATFVCVLGALTLAPVTWLVERLGAQKGLVNGENHRLGGKGE